MRKIVCDFCNKTIGVDTPEKKTVMGVRMYDGRLVDIAMDANDIMTHGVDICISCYIQIVAKALGLPSNLKFKGGSEE